MINTELLSLMVGLMFGWIVTLAWIIRKIDEHEKKYGRAMNKFRESCGFVNKPRRKK